MALAREARFWTLFVVCAAVVGPFILSPPLWDDYRREQVAGLMIGYATWIVVGSTVLFTLASP